MAKSGGKVLEGGSRKGKPNKMTKTAKEAIAFAADTLGGATRLASWAMADPRNESAFWTQIYPKLLPLQLNGAGENGEHLFKQIEWRVVRPGS